MHSTTFGHIPIFLQFFFTIVSWPTWSVHSIYLCILSHETWLQFFRGFLVAIHVILQVTLLPFTLSLAHALQSAMRFAFGLVFTVITPLDGPVSLQRVYGAGSNLVA